jgi:CRP-like cAMP-binding protein
MTGSATSTVPGKALLNLQCHEFEIHFKTPQQGKVVYFQQGQTVFHEGMLGSNLFIVLSGQVGIYMKGKLIARCKVGDAFGEMAVLNRTPRCATAGALSDASLFTLDETQLNGILRKHIAVRLLLNVIHILSERLEAANAALAGHTHAKV